MTYEEIVQSFLEPQTPEGLHIDYKCGNTFHPEKPKSEKVKFNEEFPKDVSALANTEGGIIIFGIAEPLVGGVTQYVEELVDFTCIKRERLETLISKINPPIKPKILFIPSPHDAKRGFITVEVERSKTVHQSSDNLYYQRSGSSNSSITDSTIRALMNREVHPKLAIGIKLEIWRGDQYFLDLEVWNISSKMVSQHLIQIFFPFFFRHKGRLMKFDAENDYGTARLEKCTRLNQLISGKSFVRIECKSEEPLFPSTVQNFRTLVKISTLNQGNDEGQFVRWKLNGDSSPQQGGKFAMEEFYESLAWHSMSPEEIASLPFPGFNMSGKDNLSFEQP